MPRQSLDKFTSDPDHGSYKLTLTSNEDCIHLPHNVFHDPIHATKINNLPDVLPLGVKMKTRYGSNQNINGTMKPINGTSTPSNINGMNDQLSPGSTTPTTNSAYSLKSMFSFQSNGKSQRSSIDHHILTVSNNSINQMPYTNGNGGTELSPNKFMSQSTIDLKKAHNIFNNETAIFGQQIGQNGQHIRLATTESMGNLIDCTNLQSPPPYAHHQRQQSGHKESNGKCNGSNDDHINRTDSLKENIDQIAHLQNKLLSTHLSDNKLNDIDLNRTQTIDDQSNYNDNSSNDDASSMSQLSSESITSNDINDILDSEVNDEPSPIEIVEMETIDEQKIELKCEIIKKTAEVGLQTDESILNVTKIETDMAIDVRPLKFERTIIVRRTKFTDDFDCEKLTETLVEQLSPNDRLRHILGMFLEYKFHSHSIILLIQFYLFFFSFVLLI